MKLSFLQDAHRRVDSILRSGNMPSQRPEINKHNESNVKNLYIIGDLAGAPVIKLAMQQGYEVVRHIASLPDARAHQDGVLDVLIVGAGASGLNAALEATERGLTNLLLEKGKIANTIENFPEKKWVYAEPDTAPAKGKLWLDGARKEDLIVRWHQIVEENSLEVRTEEGVDAITKNTSGIFEVTTAKGKYRARRVILAIGQRGNPRKLGVAGEDQERVYHRLYSPQHYVDENILIVGGGNSAVEAALVLGEKNRVTLSYRKKEFSRLFKDNARLLQESMDVGRIQPIFNSEVLGFHDQNYELERRDAPAKATVEKRPFDHAFVLIGAELPVGFLRSVGVRLENEWQGSLWTAALVTIATLFGLSLAGPDTSIGAWSSSITRWLGAATAVSAFGILVSMGRRRNRYAWLGISFLVWYTIYGAKLGSGSEFWPFTGWGYSFLSFANRPWSFWYTVVYTLLMTVFGIQAMKRWGFDRKDKFQIWRYVSLLSFQWIFFFVIPEFLFQWAVEYRWVGEALATDPQFTGQAWRTYGIVYAWPLFFYTFFYDPSSLWVVWGVLLSFVVIPVFAFFHGKRYCSWICGCGGLAETFGDRWRHLAPKGKTSIQWEWMQMAALWLAVAVTIVMLGRDVFLFLAAPADFGIGVYRILMDVWLVGILPVTLYPFLGGKVWCRYWCPLAKLMHLYSKWFGRFKITANDKCIACGECTRNCQVGIDVMGFALVQKELDNKSSSCIGCGICVSACPMDVLSFGETSIQPDSLVQLRS